MISQAVKVQDMPKLTTPVLKSAMKHVPKQITPKTSTKRSLRRSTTSVKSTMKGVSKSTTPVNFSMDQHLQSNKASKSVTFNLEPEKIGDVVSSETFLVLLQGCNKVSQYQGLDK